MTLFISQPPNYAEILKIWKRVEFPFKLAVVNRHVAGGSMTFVTNVTVL